jgi:hypothetical protein
MTFSSFACAQHSSFLEAPWLAASQDQFYNLEIPTNARLGADAVAVVTCMVQTDADLDDLHWTLDIVDAQVIHVFDMVLNEDNPIRCAMQAYVHVSKLTAGNTKVHVNHPSGDGKIKVSDIVVHFHVDK